MKSYHSIQHPQPCFKKLKNDTISNGNRDFQTKSKKLMSTRIKTSDKPIEKNHHSSLAHFHSSNKQNLAQKLFNQPQYKQFISLLPYQIMMKSKEKISVKMDEKTKAKHSDKVFKYLKKNQKSFSSKHKNKVMELKMKNIAGKQINLKDLNHIYAEMNGNSSKLPFYQSSKNNWFKEETQRETDDSELQKLKTQKQQQKCEMINRQNKKPHLNKCNTHIIALNKKFNDAKKKFTVKTVQTQEDERKVTFAMKTDTFPMKNQTQQDDSSSSSSSSQQEYLCSDDTGLINNLVHNSHNYQKQLSFLINSSKRESFYFTNKKARQQTCKTEGNNLGNSQNFINDIIRRLNSTTKGKTMIPSNQNSKNPSNAQSVCQSTKNVDETQKDKQQHLENEHNESNLDSDIYSLLHPKKVEKNQQNKTIEVIQTSQKKQPQLKQQKAKAFTNCTSKHPSSQLLKSNQRPQSPCQRYSYLQPQNKHQSHLQSLFSSKNEKAKRPMTSMNPQRRNIRCECSSFNYNMRIQTEPCTDEMNDNRNSELTVGTFNFCDRNISSGDNRVWKRLKSGKIVKKTVKLIKNQDHHSFNVRNSNFIK